MWGESPTRRRARRAPTPPRPKAKQAVKPRPESSAATATATLTEPKPSPTPPGADIEVRVTPKPKRAAARSRSDATAATTADTSTRADTLAAGGVGLAAIALFASTFSASSAMGDAPESIAGVKTLGILHTPGYPTYVLAARAFAAVAPIGSWATRVNLFSTVCATITIVVAFAIARVLGASRAGAAIGAVSLATAASFWFNADFAKHYALSGVLVASAALLALVWERSGRAWTLVVAGGLLGVCMGASWELAVIMAVGIAVLVGFAAQRPRFALAATSVGALVVMAVATYGFVVVRAGQDPAISWGGATTTSRLVELLTQKDFRVGNVPTSQHTLAARVPLRTGAHLGIIERDLGLAAIALAVIGGIVAWQRMRRNRFAFLAVVAVANIVAVVFVAGIDNIAGFQTGMVGGGFVIDALLVCAVFAAIGATWAVDEIARWLQERRFRSGYRISAVRAQVIGLVLVGIVAIVPSIVVHAPLANHRMPPLADDYGRRLLSELPHNAVLLTWGEEYGAPILYRQLVYGDRPDVHVISADQLDLAWYREQIERDLHLSSPLGLPKERLDLALQAVIKQTVHDVQPAHPVYLDTIAMWQLNNFLGYQTHGLVGEIRDGAGAHTVGAMSAVSNEVYRSDRDDGLAGTAYRQFPNGFLYIAHERAHIELAKAYTLQKNLSAAADELQAASNLDPDDTLTQQILSVTQQHDKNAVELIENL